MNIFESIKNEFRIPDAYENWSSYRKALTDTVLYEDSTINKLSPKDTASIAILGAGPCNDIDLARLQKQFRSLDLYDVEEDSLFNALERYGLRHSPKVNLKAVSLTGLTDALTERFFNRLYMYLVEYGGSVTESGFLERSLMEFHELEDKLYKSPEDFRSVLPEQAYDTIIAAGLHSQLWSILTYSWHILAGNVSEQILKGKTINPEPLYDYIKELDDRLIPLLNDAILKSSKRRVIMVSEADPDHPVEGAFQCINDIRNRIVPSRFKLSESTLEWPFFPKQSKKYTMLVQDIHFS